MSGPRVRVVGVPPGATRLPRAGGEAVATSDLVAGAARHLALVDEFEGERVVMGAGGVPTGEVVRRIAETDGLRATILASGDPGFFGVAALVRRRVARDQVAVHPAVSSMQIAFARVGEPWADTRFTSLHGRPLENLAPVLGAPRVGVFTDAENTPARIARFLTGSGWNDLEMVVAEDLGLPSERVTRGAVGLFADWAGSDLNVVLLVAPGPDPRPLGPGLPDEGFSHARGLITKREIRAVALGLLGLPRAGVLWDVGAGSGSVSVEACLLSSDLTAYAVEKTPEGQGHVAENRRRFRVAGLVPVEGEAPEALAGLPAPDAVFVGGSGGDLARVLDPCWTALKPGGRLVAAAVLLETRADALAWGRARGVAPALTEIASARSRPVAGRTRMEPQNPVTLVRWVREETEP